MVVLSLRERLVTRKGFEEIALDAAAFGSTLAASTTEDITLRVMIRHAKRDVHNTRECPFLRERRAAAHIN